MVQRLETKAGRAHACCWSVKSTRVALLGVAAPRLPLGEDMLPFRLMRRRAQELTHLLVIVVHELVLAVDGNLPDHIPGLEVGEIPIKAELLDGSFPELMFHLGDLQSFARTRMRIGRRPRPLTLRTRLFIRGCDRRIA